MVRRISLLALALLALDARVLPAQDTLTLDAAVADALAHNPSLVAANAAVRASDARVTEARSGYFPRVSFSESWQRGNQPVFVFGSLLSSRRFTSQNFAIDALNQPDPIGFFHGAFGVEQMVFDGGRVRAGVDAAHRQRDIADAGAAAARAGIALNVAQLYGRVLMSEAAQRATAAAVAAAEEDEARAKHRRDVGTGTDADVLALTVHLADMRQRAIQAAGDADVARAELNRLMGAPVDRTYQVQEPAPQTAPSGDLAALFAEADAARPELRKAAAQSKLAEDGSRLARSVWYPQVAAQAGYELNGTTFTDRASAWVVGGEVRWSLSAGGADLARTKAAADDAAAARASAEDARAAVHVEVVSALRRLESARARVAVGRSAVDQARESQRIIRDRFDAGMAGVSDVLRAATAVLDAETQRVSALVDEISSDAMLRHALGRTQN